MESAMTPREIQQRIRSGDTLADVISASGLPADRVEVFAAPIIAEREHTTAEALAAPVRRRGETASARRLSQTVAENLLESGQDIDLVDWDSWRRSDGRWILQGAWEHKNTDHVATFVFDPKGRFSVADNDEARILIGDLPVGRMMSSDSETTVGIPRRSVPEGDSLAEETTLVEDTEHEDSLRSDIDMLYSMISTLDEDSVRIFRGLREPLDDMPDDDDATDQQPLIEEPEKTSHKAKQPTETTEPTGRKRRKRASVPSWDEIMFGGQS